MKIEYHLLRKALLQAILIVGSIFLAIAAIVGIIFAIIWSAFNIGPLMIPVWAFVCFVIVLTIQFYSDYHKEFMEERKKIVNTLRR